jgi:hypothetical protein
VFFGQSAKAVLAFEFDTTTTTYGASHDDAYKIYLDPEEGYSISTLREVYPHRVVLAEDRHEAFKKLGLKPFMCTPPYDHTRRVQLQPFLMAKIQDGVMVWLEELRIVSSKDDLIEAFSCVVKLEKN